MTALLWEATATTRVPAPVRPATSSRPSAAVRSCTGVGRPRLRLVAGESVPDVPSRLYWTRRGLAVALALVALVVGIMAVTVVSAFLAVSNEPLVPSPVPAQVLPLAVALPGR